MQPVAVLWIDKVGDFVTLHTQDTLGHNLPRVRRRPNQDQIAGTHLPNAMGHVFGEEDVAGDVQGREHTGAVDLQAADNQTTAHLETGDWEREGVRGLLE